MLFRQVRWLGPVGRLRRLPDQPCTMSIKISAAVNLRFTNHRGCIISSVHKCGNLALWELGLVHEALLESRHETKKGYLCTDRKYYMHTYMVLYIAVCYKSRDPLR